MYNRTRQLTETPTGFITEILHLQTKLTPTSLSDDAPEELWADMTETISGTFAIPAYLTRDEVHGDITHKNVQDIATVAVAAVATKSNIWHEPTIVGDAVYDGDTITVDAIYTNHLGVERTTAKATIKISAP